MKAMKNLLVRVFKDEQASLTQTVGDIFFCHRLIEGTAGAMSAGIIEGLIILSGLGDQRIMHRYNGNTVFE